MSNKTSKSERTTETTNDANRRRKQHQSLNSSFSDSQYSWRTNSDIGNNYDTFGVDAVYVNDAAGVHEGTSWTAEAAAGFNTPPCTSEEGVDSDVCVDSRDSLDRIFKAALALNHFQSSGRSLSATSTGGSNLQAGTENEFNAISTKYFPQKHSEQAQKKDPYCIVKESLDDDDDEITYEADCTGMSDSPALDDSSYPKAADDPSFSYSLIEKNHFHVRQTSSVSIQYEADEATETKTHSTNTAETKVELTASIKAKPLCVFDDNFSTFVQTAKKANTNDMSMPDLGTPIMGEQAQATLCNFVMEHSIFAKALLPLLAQRDQYRPDEMDTDSPIVKAGPLKKASHLVRGIWKVKYVEIRKGIFSYYDDVEHEEGQLVRKNIPLNAASLKCRPVKVNQNSLSQSGGAIFELTEEGGPRRLWTANSKEERQAWMRAIQDATVGGSLTRGGEINGSENKYNFKRQLQRSPYRKDLERYLKIQKEIKNSTTKKLYVGALSKLMGPSLNVPVQWITEQATAADENDKAFHEDNVSSCVDQLWKDLQRDTVLINGDLFQGGSGHSPEKIIGALTRHIMGFDRSSPLHIVDIDHSNGNRNLISELQALSFARDILLSGNRTRSGGDSYFCVDTLCHQHDLVVAVPNSLEAEPWKVKIAHAVANKTSGNSYSLNDRSGWLKTRSKPQKPWKKRFFVKSEGTLSYYEKELPRPHGLRGQIKLIDCHVNVTRVQPKPAKVGEDADDCEFVSFLVSILNREGVLERQISFDDESKFLAWAHCFESTLKGKATNAAISPHQKHRFRMLSHLGLRDEQVDQDIAAGSINLGEESLVDNAKLLGLDAVKVAQRMSVLSNHGGKGQSTVMISVEASTDYNISTTDPQGNDKDDTWATIRATFLQSFSVSGGPNGRIIRGEEIVRLKILSCCDFRESLKESAISPRAKELAGIVSRKLRRFGSQEGGFL